MSATITAAPAAAQDEDPRVEALVHDLIGRVADTWTLLILDALEQHGQLRFTRLTALGLTLGAAFCGVWHWAAENREAVEAAREVFDGRRAGAA